MQVVVVAAVARNRVIGVGGDLPWRIPADLVRFKQLTMGNALIMGRATFESIGRPLQGRTNIVLTRRAGWSHEGVLAAGSFDEALGLADSRDEDVFVVGGAEVYDLALGRADRLELTEVDANPEGDTLFPEVDWSQWREVSRDSHPGFAFVSYERV